MAESIQAADKAQKLGKTDDALTELDSAIKIDPASKLPWLRKAQIYFDARQYGLAITTAQEALQRDTHDLTAQSILAVSGLRVSAQALEQLRKVNEVNGSARTEAESVAKLIREALGEPILVPAVDAASAPVVSKPAPRATAARRVKSVAAAASASAPVASVPVATKSAPAVAASAKTPTLSVGKVAPPAAGGRSNPFGALQ
ncbi:MAG: hypothetical protein V4532_13830 [Pseudomonadota bacterium]